MKSFQILPDKKFLAKVTPVIVNALKECEKIITPKKKVQIIVSPTSDAFVTKKMGGSSGITQSGTLINISINPSAKTWKAALYSTVAHEFNHAVREQHFNQYKNWNCALLDNIANEGLAQCFEEHITGITPLWAKAISKTLAKKLWKKIQNILKKKSYENYKKVFYGYNGFPAWGGYTLAYLIVKQKVEETNYDWKKLAKMNSKNLIGNGL